MRGEGAFGLGRGGNCEIWLDNRSVSNKRLNGFAKKLNVDCEKKRVIKEDFFLMGPPFSKIREMGVVAAMGGLI